MLALPHSKLVLNKLLALVRLLFIDDDASLHFISGAILINMQCWSEERQLLFFAVVLKCFTATKQMFDFHRQLMTNGLTSQDSNLRYLAFKCWGLCCISIESLAEQSSTKLFLLALGREKNEKIQRIILKALFDCCLMFELSAKDHIFGALCEHFVKKEAGSYSIKTRKLLVLGFCKCYASGKYQDTLVLGHLLLKCSSDLFEPEKSIRDLIWRFLKWYYSSYIDLFSLRLVNHPNFSFASQEISDILDNAFKRVVLTLLMSSTSTLEPLLSLYVRIVSDSIRLRDVSIFLIQQLIKVSSGNRSMMMDLCYNFIPVN
jgi:hypothetical protein